MKLYFVADKTETVPSKDSMLFSSITAAKSQIKTALSFNVYSWLITLDVQNPYYIGQHPEHDGIYSLANKSTYTIIE